MYTEKSKREKITFKYIIDSSSREDIQTGHFFILTQIFRACAVNRFIK